MQETKDIFARIGDFLSGLAADIKEGADILDSYVLSRRIRVEMNLKKKDGDKTYFDIDKTNESSSSLLRLLITVLGVTVAAVTGILILKNAKAQKKKAKEKLKALKAEEKRLKKKERNVKKKKNADELPF